MTDERRCGECRKEICVASNNLHAHTKTSEEDFCHGHPEKEGKECYHPDNPFCHGQCAPDDGMEERFAGTFSPLYTETEEIDATRSKVMEFCRSELSAQAKRHGERVRALREAVKQRLQQQPDPERWKAELRNGQMSPYMNAKEHALAAFDQVIKDYEKKA